MTDCAFSWPISISASGSGRYQTAHRKGRLTLIVFDNISQMVSSRVVSFPDGHRVMREVNIAVVAEEFWHFCDRKSRAAQ
jgi:hypothetical protein